MSFCCSCDAREGYVAAIEWRRVHVLRPRASTSGGQSEGRLLSAAAEEAILVGLVVEVELSDDDEEVVDEFFIRVRARQSAREVQVRHLGMSDAQVSLSPHIHLCKASACESDEILGNGRLAIFIKHNSLGQSLLWILLVLTRLFCRRVGLRRRNGHLLEVSLPHFYCLNLFGQDLRHKE